MKFANHTNTTLIMDLLLAYRELVKDTLFRKLVIPNQIVNRERERACEN